ncbi:MAG: hypothetical protein Q9163_004751 [Psora crenata]
MATVAMALGIRSPQTQSHATLSTLSDPQTPLTPPEISLNNSPTRHHPELSNEVAALSHKLIHAINHQTDLDDTLSATRHQLEAAHERIRQLERADQEYKSAIENRVLVKWADVENDTLRLRMNLAEERKLRVQAEKDKKSIEHELESLTTALFEEANQMVSAARKEAREQREIVERRNEQLQAKLNDAELLLASHQEQLAELKQAMQDMSAQRNDLETATRSSTAPSTPALETQEQMSKLFDALRLSPTTPGGDYIPPAPPTTFNHLISPILRTDIQAYEDFNALLNIPRKSGPTNRVGSGNVAGLSGLGVSNLGKSEPSHLSSPIPSNGSTSSLSASNTHQHSPCTPNLPSSTTSSISSRDNAANVTPLKETIFYKRVLVEDIEPTLRLDMAPGLSWLARRSVISSMCEGRLIVEPMPPSTKLYQPPCSLCGEQGRTERRARTHRFRINESETAQRYPICRFCLNRVRSTCDFLGFLRLVKDGHWRIDGSEAEAMAWEESVRLREGMFWSRIGGGVVPAFLRAKPPSPRSSIEDTKAVQPPTGAETGLSSGSCEPEQPLPLGRGAEREQPTAVISEPEPKRLPPPIRAVMSGQSLSAHMLQTSASQRPLGIEDVPQPTKEQLVKPVQPCSVDTREPLQSNFNRLSPTQTTTRSGGSSGTEMSPRAINSIAKRAAMFERTNPGNAALNQLQTTLPLPRKDRSPSSRIDASGRDISHIES